MPANPQSETPAEPWRSFLSDLDALLEQPTDLHKYAWTNTIMPVTSRDLTDRKQKTRKMIWTTSAPSWDNLTGGCMLSYGAHRSGSICKLSRWRFH